MNPLFPPRFFATSREIFSLSSERLARRVPLGSIHSSLSSLLPLSSAEDPSTEFFSLALLSCIKDPMWDLLLEAPLDASEDTLPPPLGVAAGELLLAETPLTWWVSSAFAAASCHKRLR